jgi:hypothetical protein
MQTDFDFLQSSYHKLKTLQQKLEFAGFPTKLRFLSLQKYFQLEILGTSCLIYTHTWKGDENQQRFGMARGLSTRMSNLETADILMFVREWCHDYRPAPVDLENLAVSNFLDNLVKFQNLTVV